jgi:hypothetical protein
MSDLYGVLGVFKTADAATEAAAHLRRAGIEAFEAYTPYPVETLNHIVRPGSKVLLPAIMFAAALFGAGYGYWIQVWDEAVSYPINVGGRPYHSWPAFIVSAFEFMLLVTIAVGLFAMIAASRMPKLYHPTFTAKAFARASRDRFVICVKASDPRFDSASLHETFDRLGAEEIEEVRA